MAQQRYVSIPHRRPDHSTIPATTLTINAELDMAGEKVIFGELGKLYRLHHGTIQLPSLNLKFYLYADPRHPQSSLNYAVDIWQNDKKIEGTYTLHVASTPINLTSPIFQCFTISDHQGKTINLRDAFAVHVESKAVSTLEESFRSDEVLDDDDFATMQVVRPAILTQPPRKRAYAQTTDLTDEKAAQAAKAKGYNWNAPNQNPALKHLTEMFAASVKHKPVRQRTDAKTDPAETTPLLLRSFNK